MSTRANIKLKDGYSTAWYYRHSDGYPSGALPTLAKFMHAVNQGKIRKDNSQGGGWLILLGAQEYAYTGHYDKEKGYIAIPYTEIKQICEGFNSDDAVSGWKVGSIEPTDCQHGDIEFLYTLDLRKGIIEWEHVNSSDCGLLDHEEIEDIATNKEYEFKI